MTSLILILPAICLAYRLGRRVGRREASNAISEATWLVTPSRLVARKVGDSVLVTADSETLSVALLLDAKDCEAVWAAGWDGVEVEVGKK